MKVACHLREYRAAPIREVEQLTGINRGYLSLMERGYLLPKDEQLPALARGYAGTPEQWYPRTSSIEVIPG